MTVPRPRNEFGGEVGEREREREARARRKSEPAPQRQVEDVHTVTQVGQMRAEGEHTDVPELVKSTTPPLTVFSILKTFHNG